MVNNCWLAENSKTTVYFMGVCFPAGANGMIKNG